MWRKGGVKAGWDMDEGMDLTAKLLDSRFILGIRYSTPSYQAAKPGRYMFCI